MLINDDIKTQERTHCLSVRELKKYAYSLLTEREKKRAETHLLECENCILALQQVITDKEAKEAHHPVEELLHPGEKKAMPGSSGNRSRLLIVLAIVAGIVLMTAAAYKFFNGTFKSIAGNINSESDPIPLAVVNQQMKQEDEPSEKIINTISESPQHLTNDPVSTAPVNPKIETSLVSITVDNKKDIEDLKKRETQSGKSSIETNKSSETSKEIVAPVQVKKEDEKEKPASRVREIKYIGNYKISGFKEEEGSDPDFEYTKPLETIFKNLDRSDYREALNGLYTFLAVYPDDPNATYYRGQTYYLNGDNEKAMHDFDRLITNHDRTFFQDARWYKILILNRTQQFDSSRKMLNQIITENSVYAAKAQQLLELIGEK